MKNKTAQPAPNPQKDDEQRPAGIKPYPLIRYLCMQTN